MMENEALIKDKNIIWNDILEFVNHWYYKADTDALAIALATYVSHHDLKNEPVWLFVIGPSGTAKTALVCSVLSCLPMTTTVSDVSTNSFISGLSTKKGGNSLLLNLTRIDKDPGHTQGVLVLKDFTSIIAKKVEARGEIMSQLRHIWDGHFNTIKGTRTVEWKGKVTIIAAVTPAIERAWSIQRDLGERFVKILWPREDGVKIALASAAQIGHDEISKTLQTKIKKLVDISTLMDMNVSMPEPLEFAYLAEMTAILRGNVTRDTTGSRTIIDVPPYEAPTRLMKAMLQIAMAHSRLFRRVEPNYRDIALAKRIAIDSIPLNRLKIVNSIHGETKQADVIEATGMPHATVDWICDELIALGVLKCVTSGLNTFYSFSDSFKKLKACSVGIDNVLDFPKTKGE
jgi:hypothetical protein